jgi:hypothetical protein
LPDDAPNRPSTFFIELPAGRSMAAFVESTVGAASSA